MTKPLCSSAVIWVVEFIFLMVDKDNQDIVTESKSQVEGYLAALILRFDW